jgi:hypothetical protein
MARAIDPAARRRRHARRNRPKATGEIPQFSTARKSLPLA